MTDQSCRIHNPPTEDTLPMAPSRSRAACVLLGLLTAISAWPALSTSPLISPPTEQWVRTVDGHVVYAAAHDNRLSALCIQVGQTASWLPADLLSDIPLPKIEDVEVVSGMGFSHIDDHVPDWGSWGVSVGIPSLQEEGDRFVDGPTYYFVLHQDRPVSRVERRWRRTPDGPAIATLQETWTPVVAGSLRTAPCMPVQ